MEDVARIWAEFWIMKYGVRSLKIEDEGGVWYLPFDGNRYKELVVSARIDVGAMGLWSESQTIATLDNLLAAQVITPLQYLQRLPAGVVPNVLGLLREMKQVQESAETPTEEPTQSNPLPDDNLRGLINELPPDYREQLMKLDRGQQEQLLYKVLGA